MDPVDVLLQVSDPTPRGRAHVVLAWTALREGRLKLVERHVNEAERLIPGDIELRALRVQLGAARASQPTAPPARPWWSRRRS